MTADPAPDGTVAAGTAPRWHDLDALRGFAMLPGVALHGSLSFFPGFWIVIDDTAASDGWFDEVFHAVHRFRMPLLFLLSGFFTMMLWRRRGTGRRAHPSRPGARPAGADTHSIDDDGLTAASAPRTCPSPLHLVRVLVRR